MNKNYLALLSFLPLLFSAQNKYQKEADYIRQNCNQESFDKAQKIYSELQTVQMENSFDRTLKNYYEFLQSVKCEKLDPLLISAWEQDKIINEKAFKTYFYNSTENYNTFIKGYILKKDFRFANSNSFDQGIDDKLQPKMLKYVASRSQDDFNKIAVANIKTLTGEELIHFISTLKKDFSLTVFKKQLIDKSFETDDALSLHFMITQLLDLDVNQSTLEDILNKKKEFWDRGNWSEIFWKLIKQEGLKINKDKSYTVDSQNKKIFNIKEYISTQQEKDLIGKQPMLLVNFNVLEYDKDLLIPTLEKLKIKDIVTIPKQKSVNLYGASGVDGALIISVD